MGLILIYSPMIIVLILMLLVKDMAPWLGEKPLWWEIYGYNFFISCFESCKIKIYNQSQKCENYSKNIWKVNIDDIKNLIISYTKTYLRTRNGVASQHIEST